METGRARLRPIGVARLCALRLSCAFRGLPGTAVAAQVWHVVSDRCGVLLPLCG